MIHQYTAEFARIGRRRAVAPLVVKFRDLDHLTDQLVRYVGRHLKSDSYTVSYDLETGQGRIDAGRFGEFTIKPTPGVCSDTCVVCGADLKRQGYPFAHQNDVTGAICAYEWEPLP